MPISAQSPLVTELQSKTQAAQAEFERRHTFAKEWLGVRGVTLSGLRAHSTKLLAGATLGSALLLSTPVLPILRTASSSQIHSTAEVASDLFTNLKQLSNEGLNSETKTFITQSITQVFGVSSSFELDGNQLPTYIGSIGLEQHLARFAGDTLEQHDSYREEGMAPGLGAFGYFAEAGKSQATMVAQEKYYVVAQTFLIADWNSNWGKLKDWYRFRKFLVINPDTGQAVVADLGDSGPAVWTGKQFGGSPEVMTALGFYPQKTRGKILFLYLDDPGNSIPLGPLTRKGG